MRYSFRVFSLSMVVLSIYVAVPNALGGISYVTQTRSVETGSGSPDTPEHFDSGLSDVRRTSTKLGWFSGSVHSEYENPSGDIHQSADASQSSNLSNDAVRANGSVQAGSGGYNAQYRTLLDITFDVGANTPYSLSSKMEFSQFDISSQTHPDVDFFTVVLRRIASDGSMPVSLVDKRLTDHDFLMERGKPEVSSTGFLAPGRYELLLDIKTALSSGGETASYNLNFTTGNSTPPTAVPLPSAAWMGLFGLAGVAAGKWWMARRARLAWFFKAGCSTWWRVSGCGCSGPGCKSRRDAYTQKAGDTTWKRGHHGSVSRLF